jgi:Ser/Thr protein kinase RdoA (MazF antagonist)
MGSTAASIEWMFTGTAREPVLPNREHAVFDAAELAVVLSHYDLGVIESITEIARGSSRSPKVGVVAERGKFLLKRRAPHRSDPDRVRLTHLLHDHLRAAGLPIPAVIGLRHGGRAVPLREHVYELFEFIPGHGFARTAEEAGSAGELLARVHIALDAFEPPVGLSVPTGDYHDAPGVRTGLCAIGSTLMSHDSFTGDEAELASLTQDLLSRYDLAAQAVNALGFGAWPERMTHADWHPGNLLFRGRQAVAVLDLDAARRSRFLTDVANGALQFSILSGGEPETWPEQLDEERFRAFLAAYTSVRPLSPPEPSALPHLMVEALIAECVPPIAETGSVGQWAGFRVMKMIRRKLAWMSDHAAKLAAAPA